MPTMNIGVDSDDRMIALGYKKRTQRIAFVRVAVQERLEREEGERWNQ